MAHDTAKIEARPREQLGSTHARHLRAEGRLPAVIYGRSSEPLHISVDEKTMLTHLRHGTHVIELQVGGGKPETCLVKDLQHGYLGDNVIHVDFARVALDEEVEVHVKLNFVGEPAIVQRAGAMLHHDLTGLAVICRVNEIPDEIKVELSAMGEEVTLLTVGQLILPPGLRATVGPETPVAHVSFVHQEEAVGEEVEVAAGPAEPEVITEAKPEEDAEKTGASR